MAASNGWVETRNAGPGFASAVHAGTHAVVVDEPTSVGGGDAGPTPYDLLLGAVGGCTAMTVRMYAQRKGWPLDEVVVRLRTGRSHAADCASCAERAVGPRTLDEEIELHGPLTDEQRARLRYIASRCPVKQALKAGLDVRDAEPPKDPETLSRAGA
jgi:putative redox protein